MYHVFVSNSYPSHADKLNLAKSLIAIFPSLNLTIARENEGYVSINIILA